tara:strand:- start:1388 stop:2212 length:825 start_codon:yes stop_codon:yes gene_type:complete
MAINLDKINGALDRLDPTKRNSATSTDVVKLEEGENVIRITPYKFDPDMPFQELHFHYAVGGKTFLCPKRMKQEDCPICDMATEAWNEFTSTNEESSKDVFKKLVATLRVFIPIVVRGQESEGIRWWAVSPRTTYKEILTQVKNAMSQGIDITDPTTGMDLIVQVKKGFNDWLVPESINLALKPSPLTNSESLNDLLDTITDINEVYSFRETSELTAAINSFANPSDASREDSSAGSVKSYTSTGVRDIDFAATEKSSLKKSVSDKLDEVVGLS